MANTPTSGDRTAISSEILGCPAVVLGADLQQELPRLDSRRRRLRQGQVRGELRVHRVDGVGETRPRRVISRVSGLLWYLANLMLDT